MASKVLEAYPPEEPVYHPKGPVYQVLTFPPKPEGDPDCLSNNSSEGRQYVVFTENRRIFAPRIRMYSIKNVAKLWYCEYKDEHPANQRQHMPTWEQQIGKIECMPLICLVNTRGAAKSHREPEEKIMARVQAKVYDILTSDEEANDKRRYMQWLSDRLRGTQVKTENTKNIHFSFHSWEPKLPHTNPAMRKSEAELEERYWFYAACMATIRFRRGNPEPKAADDDLAKPKIGNDLAKVDFEAAKSSDQDALKGNAGVPHTGFTGSQIEAVRNIHKCMKIHSDVPQHRLLTQPFQTRVWM